MFYDNMRTLQNFDELTWPQAKPIVIRNPSFPDPLQRAAARAFISTAPPNIAVYDNDTVNALRASGQRRRHHMLANELAVTADVTMRATATPIATPSTSTCRIR